MGAALLERSELLFDATIVLQELQQVAKNGLFGGVSASRRQMVMSLEKGGGL
jgi:hypothetical protein